MGQSNVTLRYGKKQLYFSNVDPIAAQAVAKIFEEIEFLQIANNTTHRTLRERQKLHDKTADRLAKARHEIREQRKLIDAQKEMLETLRKANEVRQSPKVVPGCPFDNDKDGNCPRHPGGCYQALQKEVEELRITIGRQHLEIQRYKVTVDTVSKKSGTDVAKIAELEKRIKDREEESQRTVEVPPGTPYAKTTKELVSDLKRLSSNMQNPEFEGFLKYTSNVYYRQYQLHQWIIWAATRLENLQASTEYHFRQIMRLKDKNRQLKKEKVILEETLRVVQGKLKDSEEEVVKLKQENAKLEIFRDLSGTANWMPTTRYLKDNIKGFAGYGIFGHAAMEEPGIILSHNNGMGIRRIAFSKMDNDILKSLNQHLEAGATVLTLFDNGMMVESLDAAFKRKYNSGYSFVFLRA